MSLEHVLALGQLLRAGDTEQVMECLDSLSDTERVDFLNDFHGVFSINGGLVCPLQIACDYQHFPMLRTLLDSGYFCLEDSWTNQGMHCIHLASMNGCMAIIDYLLSYAPRLELQTYCTRDEHQKTPLHLCVEHGHLNCVRLLLDSFSKPCRDHLNYSPSPLSDSYSVTTSTSTSSSRSNSSSNSLYSSLLSSSDDESSAKRIHCHCEFVRQRDANFSNVLHIAAGYGHSHIIDYLCGLSCVKELDLINSPRLSRKFLNSIDDTISESVSDSRLLLCESEPELSEEKEEHGRWDGDGMTPLMYACLHNRSESIQSLIQNGAEIDGVSVINQLTPAMISMNYRNFDCLSYLVILGANIHYTPDITSVPSVYQMCQFNSKVHDCVKSAMSNYRIFHDNCVMPALEKSISHPLCIADGGERLDYLDDPIPKVLCSMIIDIAYPPVITKFGYRISSVYKKTTKSSSTNSPSNIKRNFSSMTSEGQVFGTG